MHLRIRQRVVEAGHAMIAQPAAGQVLPMFGKVEQAQNRRRRGLPLHGEDRIAPGLHDFRRVACVQIRRGTASLQDVFDAQIDPRRGGFAIMAGLGQRPIHCGAMHPAAIMRVVGAVEIAVVVQHRQLIPHINQGDTAKRRDQRMAHQDALHRRLGLILVAGLFQAGERGKAAGNPLVAGRLVDLKQHASGKAAGEAALVEIRQIAAMRRARHG